MLGVQRQQIDRTYIARPGLPALHAWRVGNRVGESPVWDASGGHLLWIDVRAPAVLRLHPATGTLTRWALPEVVGALGLGGGAGSVVLALVRSLAVLNLSTADLQPLLTVESEPPGNRLNDGKVSPSGRWFVFGSMDDRAADKRPTGSLYCASTDGHMRQVRRLREGLTVANGIAWSPDASLVYFSDSHAGLVWRASWDETAGTLGEARPFCQTGEQQGRPDGAAVDADGHYWSAGVSAGCLNRFAPDGRRVATLPLPCRAPTMPCFGGAGLDTLFVTSLVRPAWGPDSDAGASALDGALFAVPSTVRGLPASHWA
jgi:sugar lactone lactonase YvrE